MKTKKQSDSFALLPSAIPELFGLSLLAVGIAISCILSLQGTEWIIAISVALVLSVTGTTFLFIAKLPLYRKGHYFTFGTQGLSDSSQRLYRWGFKLIIAGLGLALALFAVSLLWR